MQSVPQSLITAFQDREIVLFVGSGLSVSAGLPSANALANALNQKLRPKEGGRSDLALDEVSEQFVATFGQKALAVEVKKYIRTAGTADLSPAHFLIASLIKHRFVNTIVTTNYDTLIEDACQTVGAGLEVVVSDSQLALASSEDPKLLKMHGDFNHPELLVLTRNDYATFFNGQSRPRLIAHLRDLAGRRPVFFIGYSLKDSNFLQLLAGIRYEANRFAPRSHATVYNEAEIDIRREELAQYGVVAFPARAIDRVLFAIFDRLPISLLVTHLVFSYPHWDPHPRVTYGGIETFLSYFKTQSDGNSLSKHRHEVISVFDKTVRMRSASEKYWEMVYPASFFYFRSAVTGALQELRARRAGNLPDVIHAHFLAFAELAVEAGFPTICTSHSLLSLDLAYARGIFDRSGSEGAVNELRDLRRAEQQACQSLDTITTVSKAHRQELEDLGGSGIAELPAPFDRAPYEQRRAISSTPQQARGKLYPPIDDIFTITFVGRPDRRKGLELLFEACTTLLRDGKTLQLLLVGDGLEEATGDGHPHLKFGLGRFKIDTLEFKRYGGKYYLRSAQDPRDVALHMAASDIVVVPSLYEPMGYVILEAMASARPVVAAETGGIPEMIRSGQNGLLFRSGDAGRLTKSIRRLMDDPVFAKTIGDAAAADVASRESPQESIARYDALYQQAAFAWAQPARHHFSESLIDTVDELCGIYARDDSRVDTVHAIAALGCEIVKEVRSRHSNDYIPPIAPVDRKLLALVADRLHKSVRRRATVISVSPTYLTKMMGDLALSHLNAEQERDSITLSAQKTAQQLRKKGWLTNILG